MNTANKNRRGSGNFKTAAVDTSPAAEDKDTVAVDTTPAAEDKGTAEVDMFQAAKDKNSAEVDMPSEVEDRDTAEVDTPPATEDKDTAEVNIAPASGDKGTAAVDTSSAAEDKDRAEVLSSKVILQAFNELIDAIIKKINNAYEILKNYILKTQSPACSELYATHHIVIYRMRHEAYNQKVFKGELGHDPKT